MRVLCCLAEGQLNKSSMRDGTKRQAFSLKSLPFPLNPHAVEQGETGAVILLHANAESLIAFSMLPDPCLRLASAGLHTITVHARAVEGKHTCRWLRKVSTRI